MKLDEVDYTSAPDGTLSCLHVDTEQDEQDKQERIAADEILVEVSQCSGSKNCTDDSR